MATLKPYNWLDLTSRLSRIGPGLGQRMPRIKTAIETMVASLPDTDAKICEATFSAKRRTEVSTPLYLQEVQRNRFAIAFDLPWQKLLTMRVSLAAEINLALYRVQLSKALVEAQANIFIPFNTARLSSGTGDSWSALGKILCLHEVITSMHNYKMLMNTGIVLAVHVATGENASPQIARPQLLQVIKLADINNFFGSSKRLDNALNEAKKNNLLGIRLADNREPIISLLEAGRDMVEEYLSHERA